MIDKIIDNQRAEMYALIERLRPRLSAEEAEDLTELCRDLFTGWAYFMDGPCAEAADDR